MLGIENDGWSEPWRHLKIKTELARGRDKEAIAALEEALHSFPASISLHLLASQVYRQTWHGRGSGGRARHAGELDSKLPPALLDGRGSGDDRAVFPAARCRRCARCWTSAMTSSPSKRLSFVEVYFATAEMALGQGGLRPGGRDATEGPKEAAARPSVSLPDGSCTLRTTIARGPPKRLQRR